MRTSFSSQAAYYPRYVKGVKDTNLTIYDILSYMKYIEIFKN